MQLSRCSLAHGDHDDGRCAWCGAHLGPRRQRWCSTGCARAWAENHVWAAAREARLRADQHRCQICHDPEQLEVHHDPPVGSRGYGQGCQHHQDRLQTLCFTHHRERHAARRTGTITQLSLLHI